MTGVLPQPPKIKIDFNAAQWTGFGGWLVLGQMTNGLDLPRALQAVLVKLCARDASNPERLWSPVALGGGGQE